MVIRNPKPRKTMYVAGTTFYGNVIICGSNITITNCTFNGRYLFCKVEGEHDTDQCIRFARRR